MHRPWSSRCSPKDRSASSASVGTHSANHFYDLSLSNMDWDDLSPEQQRHLEAEAAEFERQLARVNVDLHAASPHMHELEPPRRQEVAGDGNSESYMIAFTVDHS